MVIPNNKKGVCFQSHSFELEIETVRHVFELVIAIIITEVDI